MEIVTAITSELGIPKPYIKNYSCRKNRTFVVVHCDWLASLLTKNEIPKFITHPTLSGDEIQSLFFEKESLRPWYQLLIDQIAKPKSNEIIIPLPRARVHSSNKDSDLSFAQVLHYVSETNFKNMWKHNYKKYIADKSPRKDGDKFKRNSLHRNSDVLAEIIKRFYGCKIISENSINSECSSYGYTQPEYEAHANLLPALCAVETKNSFFILYYMEHVTTLKYCVTFTPTIINSNFTKPLFVIYQLLQIMKNSHDSGLILGNLTLDDIFVNDALFIQIIPDLEENICKLTDVKCDEPKNIINDKTEKIQLLPKYSTNKLFNVIPLFPQDSNLQAICDKWVRKEISNFDYLMYLNHVAGRRFGDPACHFIMPWVSDFATRTNGSWRDLSKSKFRLNKGDTQLDLTYENALNSNQIPHHVSDVLSEITYYVYLSRRTPRSILCKHVRSVWVPAEYPSSVQRLQEWTPDECIPEFFYDPSIFKSIHEDLPDLELPHWALTPEEFIEAHRECLESKYVSERLHLWIDLTFGYKLSGTAAVKSKNVCLHLVESHKKLKSTGVVQLFHHPHPPKQIPFQFLEKMPPKILLYTSLRQPKVTLSQSDKGGGGSEDEGLSSGNGEDDSLGAKNSPLIFSKFLSRSKGSLLSSWSEDSNRSEVSKNTAGPSTLNSGVGIINLPREMNPSGFLNTLETNENFFRKTFLTKDNLPETEKKCKLNAKQVVANKRIQEMQVLGCLVIELFLYSKIRVANFNDLEKRLEVCRNFSIHDGLPYCVKSAVRLLLQPFKDHQPYITESGLPPPSAHQLLQPLLSSFLFPFPKLFPVVYSSVCNLMSCTNAVVQYKLWNPYSEDGITASLNILKIKKFKIDLEKIWEDSEFLGNDHMVDLVFSFIKQLLDDPATSKLSLIFFLDKICKCLGPIKTNELLLENLINFYNSKSSSEVEENLYLYHKKFLLILMVRCGLKVFLENFVGPLMEVVGKYKDCPKDNWEPKLLYNEPDGDSDGEITSTVSQKKIDLESSPEMESGISDEEEKTAESEVEVFSFEPDESSVTLDSEEKICAAVEHLDLNLSSDGNSITNLQEEENSTNVSLFQPSKIAIPGNDKFQHEIPQKCEEKKEETHSDCQCILEHFERDGLDFSQIKACDVAGDSIIWLAHRLGPVLTSRHLTRNLLRVLALCFTGSENLEPIKIDLETNAGKLWWKISVSKLKVVGDENVETVLRILGEVSELYGEHIILLQYFPFMSELLNLSKKKFTLTLEGGIIGCITLLKYIVPFMNDATLMDELQDVILKSIIHPIIRLVSSTRFSFPSGMRGRYTLVAKLIDCIYLISLRIGAEMTKVHIAVPALQRFFLAFDKAHGVANTNNETGVTGIKHHSSDNRLNSPRAVTDNRYLEIQRDGTTTEWSVREIPGEPISFSHVRSQESLDSLPCDCDTFDKSTVRNEILNELKEVFDSCLAHHCYAAFYRFLGDTAMENCLKNHALIRDLYYRYGQGLSCDLQKGKKIERKSEKESAGSQAANSEKLEGAGSFGSNVAVVGNKIELQTVGSADSLVRIDEVVNADILAFITREKKNSGRHLRGNWLAYWEHEIGRSEKDNKFNFKQIKLQNFTGHGNSVRIIHCLENENSFISGSKDKTVKLWSLRNQGDGDSSNGCQFTYSHHRKSLLSLSFIPSICLMASCDSTIHLWDPFVGKTISVMDSAKISPINVIKALNPPSCNIVAATTDATLKIVDARLCSFVSEYKVSLNAVGLIRSICVSPNGHYLAVGQATGQLTVLDVRTGMVLSSWKGHEAEVLQLGTVSEHILLSSSLDQTVSAWSVSDGKFKFCMKGPTEPVHCLAVYDSELITGTTANRIGVHTSIDAQASFSSTKLRSDAFRGILTSMAVLPLNKLLLLGADNGNITLLC